MSISPKKITAFSKLCALSCCAIFYPQLALGFGQIHQLPSANSINSVQNQPQAAASQGFGSGSLQPNIQKPLTGQATLTPPPPSNTNVFGNAAPSSASSPLAPAPAPAPTPVPAPAAVSAPASPSPAPSSASDEQEDGLVADGLDGLPTIPSAFGRVVANNPQHEPVESILPMALITNQIPNGSQAFGAPSPFALTASGKNGAYILPNGQPLPRNLMNSPSFNPMANPNGPTVVFGVGGISQDTPPVVPYVDVNGNVDYIPSVIPLTPNASLPKGMVPVFTETQAAPVTPVVAPAPDPSTAVPITAVIAPPAPDVNQNADSEAVVAVPVATPDASSPAAPTNQPAPNSVASSVANIATIASAVSSIFSGTPNQTNNTAPAPIAAPASTAPVLTPIDASNPSGPQNGFPINDQQKAVLKQAVHDEVAQQLPPAITAALAAQGYTPQNNAGTNSAAVAPTNANTVASSAPVAPAPAAIPSMYLNAYPAPSLTQGWNKKPIVAVIGPVHGAS